MKNLEMEDTLLAAEGIVKKFPGTLALDHVSLHLKKGEVLALLGENGAGKSTLMKILTGIYHKDEGTIQVCGKEVEINCPGDAQALGISIIHQEISMMPHLTVAQNIYIKRESIGKKRKQFFLHDNWINDKAQKLMDEIGLDIDPKALAGDLTIAKQQMVEIARAVSFNSKIVIMDEPTASLSNSEIKKLFSVIEQLKAKGVGIIYISHRLEEIPIIADRVTVMRDGQYVGDLDAKKCTNNDIIKLMVGREVYIDPQDNVDSLSNPVVLEVKNLNCGKMVQNVNFQLHRGEILGFAGLVGAGRTETMRALFGADKKSTGIIYMNGKEIKIKTPTDAVNHGIGYLSEDRKNTGVSLLMDVKDNLVMVDIAKFMKMKFFTNFKKIEAVAKEYVEKLNIKVPKVDFLVNTLSGGNQQKVVIGKWLVHDCDVFIFDEPTRGIDVGAKGEIYKLLNQLAGQNKSIIMISSELPEIMRMSHRVLVMCEGKITGEVVGSDINQEKIMELATKTQG